MWGSKLCTTWTGFHIWHSTMWIYPCMPKAMILNQSINTEDYSRHKFYRFVCVLWFKVHISQHRIWERREKEADSDPSKCDTLLWFFHMPGLKQRYTRHQSKRHHKFIEPPLSDVTNSPPMYMEDKIVSPQKPTCIIQWCLWTKQQ